MTFATLPWEDYVALSGECHPARGDVDGDGFDETIIGFGSRGHGRLAVFDDPDHGGALLAWLDVPDLAYVERLPASPGGAAAAPSTPTSADAATAVAYVFWLGGG